MRSPIRRNLAWTLSVLLLGVLAVPGLVSGKSRRPAHWAQPIRSKALPNLFRVDDHIYRSGQPLPNGYEEARALGIKSVLNLRQDLEEEAEVKQAGLLPLEVRMVVYTFTEADVVKALRAIQAAPKPVLVHCKGGIYRTGVVMAMYRIAFQGWTKKEAEAELIKGKFGFDKYRHPNILKFIRTVDVAEIRFKLGLQQERSALPGIFPMDWFAEGVREALILP